MKILHLSDLSTLVISSDEEYSIRISNLQPSNALHHFFWDDPAPAALHSPREILNPRAGPHLRQAFCAAGSTALVCSACC